MFILPSDFDEANPRDLPLIKVRYKNYEIYLDSMADKLPPSAREFAFAKWRLDPEDHRCPHDSWVVHLNIYEKSSPGREEIRIQNIDV